jgi:hypothetical protein
MIRFAALAAAFIAPVAALADGPAQTPPAQAQAAAHAQPPAQPHAWSFSPTRTGLCRTPSLVLSPFIVASDGSLIPNPIFAQIALGTGSGAHAPHPTAAGSQPPAVDPADSPPGGNQQASPSQPPAVVRAGPQAPHLAPLQPLPPPPPSLTPPHHTWVTQNPESPGLIFNF